MQTLMDFMFIAWIVNSCIVFFNLLSLHEVENMFRADIDGFHVLYTCCWISQYV